MPRAQIPTIPSSSHSLLANSSNLDEINHWNQTDIIDGVTANQSILLTKIQTIPSFTRSLFIDSSNLDEIKLWNQTGVIDGVTTNQTILLKDKIKPQDINTTLEKICLEMKNKPVSVELTDSSVEAEKMIEEAQRLNEIAPNIVIKVPIIPNTTKSLFVIKQLTERGIAVNATVAMSFEQLFMAALAARQSKKMSFISFFWGRSIEDEAKYRGRFDFMSDHKRVGFGSEVNKEPKNIVSATANFLQNGHYDNLRIIVGSIRTATMVGEAFAAGSHIVTVTPEILEATLFSQRTIETNEQFDEAWQQIQSQK